jgi:peptidoglycan/xylan/chitin deacetylase (PgdA/CDA1 family)
MSWGDVESLARAGHEIGSHTLTHANLAGLSASQLEDEVGTSFEMLGDRVGEVKHFSWPFGRFSHFSPAAARVVFETGFQSCASAERGCHVAQLNGRDLCIRRTVVVAKWPIRSTLYFLSRYSQMASAHNNGWPKGWRRAIK